MTVVAVAQVSYKGRSAWDRLPSFCTFSRNWLVSIESQIVLEERMANTQRKVHHVVTGSVSASVVEYLRNTGMTLKEIGKITGTSESFISRVAGGGRNLTVDHLQKMESHLRLPLPLLLLQATPRDSLPEELRSSYDSAAELLKESAQSRFPFCIEGTRKQKGGNGRTHHEEDEMVLPRSERKSRKGALVK